MDGDGGEPHLVVAAGGALETAFLPQRLFALRADHAVRVSVALSARALDFVTTTALRGVTGREVYVRNDQWAGAVPMHLALRRADLLLLAPATARILAACATGLVDDAPTRLFAFTPKERVVVAPALHPHLDRRIYAPHLERLAELGCAIVGGEDRFASWADARDAVVARLGLRRRPVGSGPTLLESLAGAAEAGGEDP